jgi:hypothetical protein
VVGGRSRTWIPTLGRYRPRVRAAGWGNVVLFTWMNGVVDEQCLSI